MATAESEQKKKLEEKQKSEFFFSLEPLFLLMVNSR